MLTRPQSRHRGAAAILLLLLQLLVSGLAPAADAHASAADTGTAAGVHMEKPGVHHAVHDPADCIFCIAMSAGAAPAAPASAPEAGASHREVVDELQPSTPPALSPASPVARAPPVA